MPVKIVKDNVGALVAAVKKMTGREVLVGIPAVNAAREEATGEYGAFNNASIGFVSEFGSPAGNVPARPHLVPGIRAAADKIAQAFKTMGQQVLSGQEFKKGQPGISVIDAGLTKAGIAAVSAVQKVILAGIPPGLAESTLKARARRNAGRGVRITKGAIAELAYRRAHPDAGASITSTTPLVDTSQYIHAITYVLADKRRTTPGVDIRPDVVEPGKTSDVTGPGINTVETASR